MKNTDKWYYTVQCHKNGIRIYPIFKYGYYYLAIEFNKTAEFLAHEVIKIKPGEMKYDTNTRAWGDKILELYEHLYHEKVMPKMGAA